MPYFIATVIEKDGCHATCRLNTHLKPTQRGGWHLIARKQKAYISPYDTIAVSPSVPLGEQILVKAPYERRGSILKLECRPGQKTTAVDTRPGECKLTVLH